MQMTVIYVDSMQHCGINILRFNFLVHTLKKIKYAAACAAQNEKTCLFTCLYSFILFSTLIQLIQINKRPVINNDLKCV